MAKFNWDVAVAFGTQDAEGSYNDALDAVTTTLTHALTPGADAQTAGVVLHRRVDLKPEEQIYLSPKNQNIHLFCAEGARIN